MSYLLLYVLSANLILLNSPICVIDRVGLRFFGPLGKEMSIGVFKGQCQGGPGISVPTNHLYPDAIL